MNQKYVLNQGCKLVSVQGPIQANSISSGPDQCNHCIALWLQVLTTSNCFHNFNAKSSSLSENDY